MTKKILLLFTITLLVFAAVGCGSAPDPKPEPEEKPQPQSMADVPDFFLMPPTAEDAFYGVGVAKMSSLDMSRTMSISRARDDIARQVNLQVKNAITDYAQEAGADSSQTLKFVETVSRQIAEAKLQGAKPKEMYAAKDGTIYALVEYRLDNFKEDAAEVFKRNEEAAFSEFKAAQALEKLNFEISNNPTKSSPVSE